MRHRVIPILLLLALAASGCVGPALVDEHYLGQAISTLERARDRVDAARIAAETIADDRMPTHLAATTLGELEHATAYAREAFSTRQPPRGMDDLRSDTLSLVDEAVTLLGELRISAFRGRLDAVGSRAGELEDLSARLEQRVRELRP